MGTGGLTPVPLDAQVFSNLDETTFKRASAVLENAFINEAKGHTRFPGLRRKATLPGGGRVFLHDWRGDLVAVTSTGFVYRLDQNMNATDVTGVSPSGGGRPTFAKTPDVLAIGTGGPILELSGPTTQVLSADAPQATHVGYLDGRLIGNQKSSQRFQYSGAGFFTQWDPLDFLSAEGRPDDITAIVITEFREAVVAGAESIEQFEPFPGSTSPFFRRWAIGTGIGAPYTLVAADNNIWGIDRFSNFVRFQGQTAQAEGQQIAAQLQSATSFEDAWAVQIALFGQYFIILQLPRALNPYGTEGLTLLHDYRAKRWSFLYGWDNDLMLPARWPGWSYHALWNRHFVGGEGGALYELEREHHQNDGKIQRMAFRSGHWDDIRPVSQIDSMRMRVRRGLGTNEAQSQIQLRSKRDNARWSNWQVRGLGLQGDSELYVDFGAQGEASAWQFEYVVTDDVPLEVVDLGVDAETIG